ncbi:MAG: hypothetical protein ACPKM0_00735 [Pleomorphochaeta sp.]
MNNEKEININNYINSIKEEARPWITEMTKYFSKKYPSLKLEYLYNLPGYQLENDNYIVFGINKNYLSIHTRSFELVKSYSKKFEKANTGKGCVRLKYNNLNNIEVLKSFVDEIICK